MSSFQAMGIDIGSATAKIVAVDGRGEMVWHLLEPAEPRLEDQVARFLDQARRQAGPLEGVAIVATGYGRKLVPGAVRQVTEISCHARGVFSEFGRGGTLVDIGGQDSKVIALDPDGVIRDFAMNDKCAAGTGRFLEVMARTLEVDLDEMGRLSRQARSPVSVSSTCTVFAESEVVSLIAQGHAKDEIIAGLHNAIADRVASLVQRVGLAEPAAMTGGVAKNAGVVRALESKLGVRLLVPPEPQIVGALGAALIALERRP
jgi:predicted CoA-substrate-specific enzyme activase